MRIDPGIPNLAQLQAQDRPALAKTQAPDDFGSLLMDALKQVSGTQAEARQMQNDLMAGQPVEFHDLMIAMEKASVGMQLTVQVRNKLLEAYQEISRMQV